MSNSTVTADQTKYAVNQSHAIPAKAVQFRIIKELEFINKDLLTQNKASESQIPLDKITSDDFKLALKSFGKSNLIETNKWGEALLGTEGWVYIFRIRGWGLPTLDMEAELQKAGDIQSFKLVSWVTDDRPKWITQYPRATSVTKKVLYLNPDDTYFVLYSTVQLPYHRIDYYSSKLGFPSLKNRSLEIAKGDLRLVKTTIANIDLPDPEAIAKGALEKVILTKKALSDFDGDKTKRSKLYLAEFLTETARKEKKVEDWIKAGQMRDFTIKHAAQHKKLRGDSDSREAFFFSWISSPQFEELRGDHYQGNVLSSDKKFQAIAQKWSKKDDEFSEGFLASKYGIQWLGESAEKNTWRFKLLRDDDGNFFLKGLEVFKEGEAAGKIGEFLVGRVVLRTMKNELIPDIFLAKKSTPKIVVPNPQIILPGKGSTGLILFNQLEKQTLDEAHFIIESIKQNQALKHLVSDKFLLPLTTSGVKGEPQVYIKSKLDSRTGLYTLDYAIPEMELTSHPTHDSLHKAKTGKAFAALGRFGLLVSTAIEFSNLQKDILVLYEKSSDQNKNWELAEVSASIFSTTTKLGEIGKSIGKKIDPGSIWGKFFQRGNIIGTIACFFLDLYKVNRNYKSGRYGLASGYGVSALAGLFSTMALLGEAGFIFSAASAIPFGIIGVFLAILGVAIVYYFTESEFEEWAKNSCWGKEGNTEATSTDLEDQIEKLNGILAHFSADVFIRRQIIGSYIGGPRGSYNEYSYSIVLRIKAGHFIKDKSRFKVNLGLKDRNILIISSDDVDILNQNESFLIPGPGSWQAEVNPNSPEYVFYKSWPLKENYVESKVQRDKYKYDLSIKLDLHGDGLSIYPNPKYKKPFKQTDELKIEA